MQEFIKQWWLEIIIIFFAFILFVSGFIFDFFPSVQVVIKKTFLVAWWYLLTYVFRRFRLGKIEWSEDEKKVYYFILLCGSALIFALG
jgi:hypothetical protein